MNPDQEKSQSAFKPLALSVEIGFHIALPIVLLGLGGRYLDTKMDTSPLFLLLGIFLSLVISGILVWRTMKPFI